MTGKIFTSLARACVAASLLLGLSLSAVAQTSGGDSKAKPVPAASKSDEKSEAIIKRAVELLGGHAFLGVRTVVSEGNFTPFAEGVATYPIKFTDYLAFPNRERTEFRGRSVRSIQTYDGDAGWLYDGLKGPKGTITDATPEQVADFRTAMRTSLDNLLRGWWRREGAELSHAGRREAGLARRNDVLRLTYPDGFVVEFEFDTRTGMPSKVVFRKKNSEGEEVDEEDRLAQFVEVGGVQVPFVIDHFRAGQQTSRINYQKIQFNLSLPDSLFARPADVKAIKM